MFRNYSLFLQAMGFIKLQTMDSAAHGVLKGTVTRLIFFEGTYNLLLPVHALMVFKIGQKLITTQYPIQYTIINFLFDSLKLLTNFENAY
jgi:hypothetical protein